jgi:voltage-gated potassium channel
MLPSWLRALGAEVTAVRRLRDDEKALHKAITGSTADLIVTTGGTASGPVDHVHPTLRRIGAELLVDGVKVRPGHPMLLARIKDDQHLVGLPGNPLAAISGLLTLAEPLLRTLSEHPAPEPYALPLQDAVHGHPYDTRLIPAVLRGDSAVPLHYNGPAMLRGIAGGRRARGRTAGWCAAGAAGGTHRSALGGRRDRGVFHVKQSGHDAIARQADEHLVTHRVELPKKVVEHPFQQVAKRLSIALFLLVATALIVYADHEGYNDNSDGSVDFLDAFYYATVTLSTTGYGDITPVSDGARLTNILVVTPLRVFFLIVLVGTTLEVLTERTREEWRLNRWRSTLRDHTVVIGFGTKGRSAIQTVCATGLKKEQVVVVDPSGKAIEAASSEGYVGVVGDATRSEVLKRAEVHKARQIIIATQRDDTAVLVTLTARQLNRGAKIVAAVREEENAPLLKQSGADAVITSASAAGRLLGLSVLSPAAGMVMEDLIQQGSGLDMTERPVIKAEVGKSPRDTDDLVVSVVRGHRVLGYDDPAIGTLQLTDRLITIVRVSPGSQVAPDTRPLPQ